MRPGARALVAALLAGCASGAADRDALPDAPLPLCDRLCAVRAAIPCARPESDCATVCEKAVAGACAAAWTRYFTCAADLPAQAYHCSPEGQPLFTSAACDAGHEAVQACLVAPPRG
jgi:hypothetical protein